MLDHGDLLGIIGSAASCLVLVPYFVVDHLDAEQGMAEEITHICICCDTCVGSLHLDKLADVVKRSTADKELPVKKRINFAHGICGFDHSVCVINKTAVDVVMHGLCS